MKILLGYNWPFCYILMKLNHILWIYLATRPHNIWIILCKNDHCAAKAVALLYSWPCWRARSPCGPLDQGRHDVCAVYVVCYQLIFWPWQSMSMSYERIDIISRYVFCWLVLFPILITQFVYFYAHYYCVCIRSFLSIFNCSLSKKHELQFYQFF